MQLLRQAPRLSCAAIVYKPVKRLWRYAGEIMARSAQSTGAFAFSSAPSCQDASASASLRTSPKSPRELFEAPSERQKISYRDQCSDARQHPAGGHDRRMPLPEIRSPLPIVRHHTYPIPGFQIAQIYDAVKIWQRFQPVSQLSQARQLLVHGRRGVSPAISRAQRRKKFGRRLLGRTGLSFTRQVLARS